MLYIPRLCGNSEKSLAKSALRRFCFIHVLPPGFLDSDLRRDLIELARDGSAAHRLARRANALVLLDKGMSCQSVAEVLLLDGDTIRSCTNSISKTGSRVWRASAMKGAAAG